MEIYPVLRDKTNLIFRHPPYFFVRECKPDPALLEDLKLAPSRKYFLIIGSIEPYKNIECFLETLAGLDPGRYGLVIAGRGGTAYVRELMARMRPLLEEGFDIKMIIKWLSELEIATLVRRMDFVVCNNSPATLTSGIPHLCESGLTLLYTDTENPYLRDTLPDCLLHREKLEEAEIQRRILKNLQSYYEQNNPALIGTRLRQIIGE